MTSLEAKHMQLVDAVNNSRTRREHDQWFNRLCGFRQGVEVCGGNAACLMMHADEVQRTLGVVRQMIGGVWLDWEPSEA
jgi:hypothetical protein